MNDFEEIVLEGAGLPFKMFAEGDMYEIEEEYTHSRIGTFNKNDLYDLKLLNDKSKSGIAFVTEDGRTVAWNDKTVIEFGRCYVGEHNPKKILLKNMLKTTPIKFHRYLANSKERITAEIPVSAVKPGQVTEITLDWKPLVGSRKPLKCDNMITFEPMWSKRMDVAIYGESSV